MSINVFAFTSYSVSPRNRASCLTLYRHCVGLVVAQLLVAFHLHSSEDIECTLQCRSKHCFNVYSFASCDFRNHLVAAHLLNFFARIEHYTYHVAVLLNLVAADVSHLDSCLVLVISNSIRRCCQRNGCNVVVEDF